MTISDNQKIDYLFKKIGYGATKTDTNANKLAPNEAIPSPLLIRGDKVWQQAASIPSVKPSSSAGVVTCYTGASVIECTADNTATTNRTWKTGETDWIPTQFGSTYLVNVYVHTASDAANAASISNKVFVTGSGNDDEWFFDYESGVLNFIGTNFPNGVNFSGKSVYIEGARYTGAFGVGGNTGTIDFSGNTLTTATSGDDFTIDPEGGTVIIAGSGALEVPAGSTAQRPSAVQGQIRYNTDVGKLEVYTGSEWIQMGSSDVDIGAYTFSDNRIQTTYTNEEIILDPGGSGIVVVDGTTGLVIPVGTTIQRPSGEVGMIRFNSTTSEVEVYNGGAWVSISPSNTITKNDFTGNGSDTAFTLGASSTTDGVIVTINGAVQAATAAYTVSGTTLTFTEAPDASAAIQVRSFHSGTAQPAQKFQSFTTTQRDALSAANGDVVYNSTLHKFQGYANGAWVNFH